MNEPDRLRALSKRLAELESRQPRQLADLRASLVAVAVATVVFALTAATWFTNEDRYGTDRYTLWGLVPEGWLALVTLVLVIVTCSATIGMVAGSATSRAGHLVLVGVSLAAAVAVLSVGSVADKDAASGPARWLTLFGVVVLAVVHGARAGELRATHRGR